MKHFKLVVALLLLLVPWGAWAADPPQHLDILIVIDSRKPAHVKEEHELRTLLEKNRALHSLDSRDLPVDTYDIADAGQKTAVDRLKIPDWQLPFLGLSELGGPKNEPQKVVFGGGPVDKIEETVGATMAEAFKKLGVKGLTTAPSASPSVAPIATGPATLAIVTVEGNAAQAHTIELLRFDAVKARDERGLTKSQLVVFHYHWGGAHGLLVNLGIRQEETPLICVVSLRNRVPTKVLYRLANVKDPAGAARDCVGHAAAMLPKAP